MKGEKKIKELAKKAINSVGITEYTQNGHDLFKEVENAIKKYAQELEQERNELKENWSKGLERERSVKNELTALRESVREHFKLLDELKARLRRAIYLAEKERYKHVEDNFWNEEIKFLKTPLK